MYPDSFYTGALPTNSADDCSFTTDLPQHASHRVTIGELGEYEGGRFDRPRVQAFVNSAQASSADCGAIAGAWNGDGSAGHMNADSRPDYLHWIQSAVPN